MLKLFSAVTAIAIVYLCEHPDLIGNFGLELQLKRKSFLAWFAKQAYRSAFGVFAVVHQVTPNTDVDEIARFEWLADRDAELVARVQTAEEQLSALRTTEVPVATSGDDEYTEMFNDMRQSYPEFSEWHDLGFQGQNPATDFRGVGKLGVILFRGFCTERQDGLRKLIVESRSATKNAASTPWYPLALVSIRLTNSICELLKKEKLIVVHLLQLQQRSAGSWLDVLQQVHDDLLLHFHDTWLMAERAGTIKTYFDNELILKTFEQTLPLRIYRVTA